MIIKVLYNKITKELSLENDVPEILINNLTIVDTDTDLNFEISVDTSTYEQINNPELNSGIIE